MTILRLSGCLGTCFVFYCHELHHKKTAFQACHFETDGAQFTSGIKELHYNHLCRCIYLSECFSSQKTFKPALVSSYEQDALYRYALFSPQSSVEKIWCCGRDSPEYLSKMTTITESRGRRNRVTMPNVCTGQLQYNVLVSDFIIFPHKVRMPQHKADDIFH